MAWLKTTRLLLCIIFLTHMSGEAFAADARLNLTAGEKEWLEAHPEIRVAPDPDFAPFEWLSLDGSYKGMAADYLRLVEQRLGIKFKLIHAKEWSQVMDMARARQIDVLPALARSPQREKYLLFTTPHISAKGVIVTGKDYESIQELKGKKIAVVADYVWDDWITYNKFDVRLYRVERNLDGLELAALGGVDAMVSDIASVAYLIRKHGFSNLRIVKDEGVDRNLGR